MNHSPEIGGLKRNFVRKSVQPSSNNHVPNAKYKYILHITHNGWDWIGGTRIKVSL